MAVADEIQVRGKRQYLRTEEFGGGIFGGIEGGDMYKTVDIVFSNGFSDALSAFDMYIFQREVPVPRLVLDLVWGMKCPLGRIVSADEVVDDI